MMRFLPFENPLSRLFKNSPRIEFQAMVHGTPHSPVSQEDVEAAAEAALDLLLESARDTALGPAVGYDPATNQVEILFTICASSVEDAYRRLGHVLSLLERGAPFELQESTTSRVAPEDREPVPA